MTQHKRLYLMAERFLKRRGAPMYQDGLAGFLADFGMLVRRSTNHKPRIKIETLRKAL